MAKAHVYKRDHINTDEIIPARYLNTDDVGELAKHCMEDLDTGFVGKCSAGDVIVGGVDFGCGSSRDTAPRGRRSRGSQRDGQATAPKGRAGDLVPGSARVGTCGSESDRKPPRAG